MQHFYAGFAPIAAKICYVAAPGAMLPNFNELPYRKVNRQMWPLNPEATWTSPRSQ
jgi:microcystin degradation protein MlrC